MKWTGEKFKNKYYIGPGCDGNGPQLSEDCIAVVCKWPKSWWVKKNQDDPKPLATFDTKGAAVRWCMVN